MHWNQYVISAHALNDAFEHLLKMAHCNTNVALP